MDDIAKKNQEKFSLLRSYNLPLGQYLITGSGALGIRNLREIGDIDILVTQDLWNLLAKKYDVVDEKGITKIPFPDGVIEALQGNSFADEKDDPDMTIAKRIAEAEIIDGLPFESLHNLLIFKQKMGRPKDIQDIELIQKIVTNRL